MFSRLSLGEKLSAVASASVLGGLAFMATLRITRAPGYSQFIVGSTTWSSDTKFRDLASLPVGIVVFSICLILLTNLLARLKRLHGEDASEGLSQQLLWWSLPAVAAVSSLLLGASVDEALFLMSAAGILFLALVHLLNPSKTAAMGAGQLSLGIFAILIVALIPLEIALVLGRAPNALIGEPDHSLYARATYVLALLGLLAGAFLVVRRPTIFTRALPGLLAVGQLGLSAIFLTLYPSAMLLPDGSVAKYSTSFWLKALVVAFVLASAADVIRRYKPRVASVSALEALSPIAVFALLVGVRAGTTVAPIISPDDYHFGETLLGWWSYTKGAIPYVDYIPPHGLIVDDLGQMLSFMFYDGSAASVPEASRLGFILLAFVAFMSMYAFTRHLGLAFAAIFFSNGWLGWLFLTPFVCLWLSRRLMDRPARWLAVWLLTVPVVILGIPPQGLLLVAASGVIAAASTWRMYRSPDERNWGAIGGSVFILSVAAIVTPMVAMVTGAIHYVLDNAAINQVAYGLGWVRSLDPAGQPLIVLETIRSSWVVVPIVCMVVMYVSAKSRATQWNALLSALVVFLFVLVLVPYAMGRIDPGNVSRSGRVASFALTVLLPVVLWRLVKGNRRTSLLFFIVSVSAALNFVPLSSSSWVDSASARVAVPPTLVGGDVGLENIGTGYVHPDHLARLTRLDAVLEAELDPGEAYLDLSSRNAQYFYLDRRPVIPVTAVYNMVGFAAQEAAVEALEPDLPRLAVLAADNVNQDGGGLPLRTPYLYRFVIDNYVPQHRDGFIIGLRRTEPGAADELGIDVALSGLSDINWDRGIRRTQVSLLVDDPVVMSVVKVGDLVELADGQTRSVMEVLAGQQAIRLEGPDVDPGLVGHPHGIKVQLGEQGRSEYNSILFQEAFGVVELQSIPVAWGRSADSLATKVSLVADLAGVEPVILDLEVGHGGVGTYEVTGADPNLTYDIAGLDLEGRDAGLLRFDFHCAGQLGNPRLQVFWWGDDHLVPFEESSMHFDAADGALIVPLDASPRWLLLERLRGLRIDLADSSTCAEFSIENLELLQREFG